MPNTPPPPVNKEQNGLQRAILWIGGIVLALNILAYKDGHISGWDVFWLAVYVYVAWLVAGSFVRIALSFPSWVFNKIIAMLGDLQIGRFFTIPSWVNHGMIFGVSWLLLFGFKDWASEKKFTATINTALCLTKPDMEACVNRVGVTFWTNLSNATFYAVNVWTFGISVVLALWMYRSHFKSKKPKYQNNQGNTGGFKYEETRFHQAKNSDAYGHEKHHPDDLKLWNIVNDPAANENEQMAALRQIKKREAKRTGNNDKAIR
jgi:hypothetical protein